MPFKAGKFSGPGASQPMGSKLPPASTPKAKVADESEAPHGVQGPKHVTETHKGMTQPHPMTGVHSVHGFHKGGGKYESHTHHDGGDVEVKQHPSSDDMYSSMQEAMPSEGGQPGDGMSDDSMDYSDALGGVGHMDSES